MDENLELNFFGDDYVDARDRERMTVAMGKVFDFLHATPQEWFSIEEISEATDVPASSVGSYISYIRRDAHFTAPKKYIDGGLYLYNIGKKMTQEQIIEMQAKSHKPVGDKQLWGEYMRSIYAYANAGNDINHTKLKIAERNWRMDMVERCERQG